MKEKSSAIGTTLSRRLMRKGTFVAEIKADGNVFRFVIRDESGTAPSIHGSKKSLQESETEVKAVLNQLCLSEHAA
jgi:hypothetical protein